MQKIIDEWMIPEELPTEYKPFENTTEWIKSNYNYIFIEIYTKKDEHYRFRYIAWVAFRDADDNIRDHSWDIIEPNNNYITENIDTIKSLAITHSKQNGITVNDEWNKII